MIKLVYLGLPILKISKIVIHEFWCNYGKPKYRTKANLCYMDTSSFFYIKTEDFYSNNAKDVETRFDTSDYQLDRPLPKGENKRVYGLMKDELG